MVVSFFSPWVMHRDKAELQTLAGGRQANEDVGQYQYYWPRKQPY